jgi:hypothetical protein
MPSQAIFGIGTLMAFVVWGIVVGRHVWPVLRHRPRADALRPILLLHAFRFEGLAFLISGVVSPDLPSPLAHSAAYGDFLTALLALSAYALLRGPLGTASVWAFNIVGTVDLLNAYYEGSRNHIALAPGLLGTLYFIPTLLVPLLLVTHAVVFRLLLQRDGARDGGRLEAPRQGSLG